VLRRHDGADSPDRRPLAQAPMRSVRRLDGQSVGPAPGLDDGPEGEEAVQLPILGES